MQALKNGPSAFLFLLIFLFATSSFAAAQESNTGKDCQVAAAEKEKKDDLTFSKDYLWGYLSDVKSIVTSPARWDGEDWKKAFAVVGVTAGLYFYDQDIRDWVQKHKNGSTQSVSNYVSYLGDGFYTGPALGLFYLYGSVVEDSKAKRASLLGLESLIISGAFAQVLKYTGHRTRPADGNDYDQWRGPSFSSSDLSFCSGHATTAFSVATVLAYEYRDNRLVPPIVYGLAALTALSRIHDDAHWTSDAFLGSAIGYFTAKAVIALHAEHKNIRVFPLSGGTGLTIGIEF
jgi:hypothetical protein